MPANMAGSDEEGTRILSTLKRVFGHEKLRPLQEKIVRHVLSGGSGLVLLPTGAGKSLCFQLPALLLPGVSIVVSPLLALMQDQVGFLKSKGIDARMLSSMQDRASADAVYAELSKPHPCIRILYVTPERVAVPTFADMLRGLHQRGALSLLAIDEAHCISSWGVSFRPAYRKLVDPRNAFPDVPCLALTATATAKVVSDIKQQLKLPASEVFRASFDRPNIRLTCVYKDALGGRVYEDLAKRLHGWLGEAGTGASAIVYCRRRQDCEEAMRELSRHGFRADVYHAGVPEGRRKQAQVDFDQGRIKVMCATVAFGMGIDKSDVRVVAHMALPQSLDAFQQESGRAGRDQQPSESIVYYSRRDAHSIRFLIEKEARERMAKKGHSEATGIEAQAERELEHLQKVVEYCELADGCRRRFVLKHFGEELARKSGRSRQEKADCCDYCPDEGEAVRKGLQFMLLAESGGASSRRGGGGYGRRFQDEGGVEEVEEYDHDAAGEEEEDEDDGEEVQDPEVARALLTGSSVFQKHAARHLAPTNSSSRPVSQRERTMALLDTWVAVEDELENKGKPQQTAGRSWKQGSNFLATLTSGNRGGGNASRGGKRARPQDEEEEEEEESSEEEEEDAFAAIDEDEQRHGVSASRRRKVIQHLYEDGKGRVGKDKQARARLLKEIRHKEHEWITRAKCKADYQATVRGVMESLR